MCDAIISDSHDQDCSYVSGGEGGGDCHCQGVNYVHVLGGVIPIGACPNGCGEKIMQIIRDNLPQIASLFPPLLRKQAEESTKTAGVLERIERGASTVAETDPPYFCHQCGDPAKRSGSALKCTNEKMVNGEKVCGLSQCYPPKIDEKDILPGTRTCSHCQKMTNLLNARHCPFCGTRLPELSIEGGG